jgi:3-hydroxy-9,10-secoandrosta-1,3,5(10)-triene-9,17-dione monooxygenase reductase component
MPLPEDASSRFRAAVGRFATGVCVITSHSEGGPTGLTLNAFASLSLDPLLVVVCFDKTSRTLAAARRFGRVGVNVLAADQDELARRFAGKGTEEEKFAGVAWRERDGVPALDGAVAWLAGPLRELLPGGDHLIGVIEAEQFDAGDGEPLVFCDGRYTRLA